VRESLRLRRGDDDERAVVLGDLHAADAKLVTRGA
jgi:hypothetical protein